MKNVTTISISTAMQAGLPVLLVGPPGTGKTSFIRGLGRALGLRTEVVIGSIREPTDICGFPVLDSGTLRIAPPDWSVSLAAEGRGILFLDELTTCPPAVQAALLRVVLERVVGRLELPAGVLIAAACNPPDQAAGGWGLAAPMANRFCHFEWRVEPVTWAEGMVSGFPTPDVPRLPEGWEQYIPASRGLVAAFVRERPTLGLAMPKEEAAWSGPWPSYRTWDMAARGVAACKAVGVSQEVETQILSGCVGEHAALEFLHWRQELDLPDPEQLLSQPEAFHLPKRGDQQYAVLVSVIAAATREPVDKARVLAAWKIIDRARVQGAIDIALVAARPLAAASQRLGLTPKEAKHFRGVLNKLS